MKRWPREKMLGIWTKKSEVKRFTDICFEKSVTGGQLLNLLLDLYDKDIKPYRPDSSFA